MQIILLAIGLVAGFLIAWFYMKMKQNDRDQSAAENSPVVKELRSGIAKLMTDLSTERTAREAAVVSLATAEANLKTLHEKLREQDEQVTRIRDEFSKEFENLANRIFDDKSKKITEQNRNQLDLILNPLKDKLREFENKVEKVYNDENAERINLKAEIKMLSELNKQLSTDANNLATALKGDNKTQGNWGELILEKILERSGLVEGLEYKTQDSSSNVNDEIIRPDVVVYLPEDKHLIVDSKVSLVAYNSMIAASSDEDRMRFMRAHAESIRSHVRLLGDKNYQTARGFNSPDFVILFMPIEAAFATAMQYDGELYNFAWDRKVVIVSPTTLLATLRTVSSIWMQERRTRNVEAIADEGGKLYDKFVSFVEDMESLGLKMKQAGKEYDAAMNKLSSGTGNLISRTEKMRKLGAKATKQINKELTEKAEEGNDA